MNDYAVTTTLLGGTSVEFTDDSAKRDMQVNYITVNGSRRESEDQIYNSGVYQNGSCGGGNGHCEWRHCNGGIG